MTRPRICGGPRVAALWAVLACFGGAGSSVGASDEASSACSTQRLRDLAPTLGLGAVHVASVGVAGSSVELGCGVVRVPLPLGALRRVIADAESYDEFLPRVRESEAKVQPDGSVLNRQVLDLPFPVADREYSIRIELTEGQTDGGAGTWWSADWTYVEGSGNVASNEGGWRLEERSAEETLLIYRVLSDPGGYVPKWAVNTAGQRALRDVIDATIRRARMQLSSGG